MTSLSFLLGILHPESNKNHHVSSNQAARSFLRGPKFLVLSKNHEKSLQRAQNRPFQLPNTKMYLSGTSLFRQNSITAFGDHFLTIIKACFTIFTPLYSKSDLLQLHKLVSAFPDRLNFIILSDFCDFSCFLMSDLVDYVKFQGPFAQKHPQKQRFSTILGPFSVLELVNHFCRAYQSAAKF